ncbi:MAG TPA: pitrilysin family protein [Dehalococcoidia bacterium]|nr:pitrilysin family protein [Dehalococcoidia bacterium]
MTTTWQIDTLDNGLRVVTTPMATAQSVNVCIFVGVGSRMEERRTNGICHYLEHMLFKGSAKRPTALDISQAVEGAGGGLNAFTSKEFTGYWAHVPFDRLDLAVDVLADMVRHPLLDGVEIGRERTVVQQEIRRAHDQPAAWAGELLSRACYGDQPIGWPVAGTEESVEAVRRDDFLAHMAAWYVPENTVVAVAGNMTPEQVVALIEERTADAERRATPPLAPSAPGLPPERVQVEARDTDQSNLYYGLRAISRRDPDRYSLTILNSVLGRGMSSRLFKEVRERRGLAYSVGSSVSRHHDTGVLAVSAGVSPEKAEEAGKVILEEVFKLVDELVPEDELTRARDFTVGNFRLSLETTMALTQWTGENLVTTGEVEEIDDVVSKLAAVTAEDVRRVAKRLFSRDNVAMSLVGPGADAGLLEKTLPA